MLSFQLLVTTFLVSITHSVIDHTQYVTSPNIRERDMATHRGNRFVVEYNDTHPRYYFATQAFAGGLRTDANFAADFEDPKAGTYGWTVDSSRVARNTIRGAHYNTFDYPLSGPLANLSTVHFRTGAPYAAVYVNGQWFANGTHSTPNEGLGKVDVAVFNFLFIDLAVDANVTADGEHPLIILSRTNIIWHGSLTVQPGTLGGWSGWGGTAGASGIGVNDRGGLGSGTRAVYSHTLKINATDIDEIQTWTTTVGEGENLGGGYTLSCKNETTRPIPWNASPRLVKQIIESGLARLGEVQVTRTVMPDDGGGFTWNATFVSAISDIPQIIVDGELLTGMFSKIVSRTIQHANAVGGSFTLQFLGATTTAIPFDASAETVRKHLVEDIPNVVTAHVARTDSTASYNEKGEAVDSLDSTVHAGLCEDGSCNDGAGPAGGLIWTILTSTIIGIVSPPTPTSPEALAPQWTQQVQAMTVNGQSLTGSSVQATIFVGHIEGDTRIGSLSSIANFDSSLPFTLAFGGSGGTHGGVGGGSNKATSSAPAASGPMYGDDRITGLYGGSSGAIGGQLPLSRFLRHAAVAGRGGAGGGVVEIVAHNDLTFHASGGIFVDGEPGAAGAAGGGGGAGGAIVLVAGGAIRQEGVLSARGGQGGACVATTFHPSASTGSPGSGGGGGRLAVYAQSVFTPKSAKIIANGGTSGVCVHNATVTASTIFGSVSSSGSKGSFYVSSMSNVSWYINTDFGALGTARSLVLVGGENAKTASGLTKLTPYLTGMQVEIQNPDGTYANSAGNRHVQPRRVTVYIRFESTNVGTVVNAQGGQIALHPTGGRDGIGGRGSMGRGIGADLHARQGGDILIGVAAVNGNLYHSANYDDMETMIKEKSVNITNIAGQVIGTDTIDPGRLLVLESYEFQRWYKIDIFISWKNSTYNIRLDDVSRINQAPFRGVSMDRLGVYTYHNTRLYVDEIFAGDEQTINFKCPVTLASQDGYTPQGVKIRRPWETTWGPDSLGTAEEDFHSKVRHTDSFFQKLPRFALPRDENGVPTSNVTLSGLIPFDGPGNTKFISGVTQRFADGDYESVMGKVEISVFMYDPLAVPSFSEDSELTSRTVSSSEKDGFTSGDHGCTSGSQCSGLVGKTGRYYWYGEHHDSEDGRDFLKGSVVSCSTTDFINWRNEGTMLHFSNLTDNEHPEMNQTDLIVERPKVVYNKRTGQYVMWMHLDDRFNLRRLAAVAVSNYPNGPFTFVRSFLPDTNETQDMTVMTIGEDAALVRTYYATTEFVLASPVMQPMWESVKKPSGVSVSEYEGNYKENRNFGLNYHRSNYHPLYDDNDDICYQRLRAEDRPYFYKSADDECTRQAPTSVQYTDRAGSGLQVMDPPVLTYFSGGRSTAALKRQVYYPEDLTIEDDGGTAQLYLGGAYDDCHSREAVVNSQNIKCGFGNDNIPHPKVDPPSNEAKAYWKLLATLSLNTNGGSSPEFAKNGANEYDNKLQVLSAKADLERIASETVLWGLTSSAAPQVSKTIHEICEQIPICEVPNTPFYSDYITKVLGLSLDDRGQLINDDQPERPPRPGQLYSHCCDQFVNDTGSVHPTLFYTTESEDDKCLAGNDGAGFPYPLKSRYKYTGLTHVHDFWSPSSVPNIKGHIQPWSQNYMDGNIADNPVHSTKPDELIAPSEIVFTRRAKYVSITKLTDNYLEITKFTNLFEGEAINRTLNSILDDFGQFGWSSGEFEGGTTEHHQIWATDVDQQKATKRNRSFPEKLELARFVAAGAPVEDTWVAQNDGAKNKPPFDAEEVDWLDRFWQFNTEFGDRRKSPINFLDQINGRRQWDGSNSTYTALGSSYTLKDRASRVPLDRNCIYKDAEPPVWTNQLGFVSSLYKIAGTWGSESAGGGEKGSSKQYNYNNDQIKTFASTQTSNAPNLISGLAYIGQKNSWSRRSPERNSEENPTGTELGLSVLKESVNFISSYPVAQIASISFSSPPNKKCKNLDAVKKRLEEAAMCFSEQGKICQYTNEQGQLVDYCAVNAQYCNDMICVKEKVFDDDYYREMSFPAVGAEKGAAAVDGFEEILEEPIGFHGFFSEGANKSANAYIGVKLKQSTENPIIKVFTAWTKNSLTAFFNRVVPPVNIVPSISLSLYISKGPAHTLPGFPDAWLKTQTPCGEVSNFVPYPDHDGSAVPAMCLGKGNHIYMFNNTMDPDDQQYYLIVSQMDVVGTIQLDRPDIPHPSRVVEFLTPAQVSARIAANTMTAAETCPTANLGAATKVACETVEEAPRCMWKASENKCYHRNPDHHGTVGTGDFRYSVGENSITYPAANGFRAPGWTGVECTTVTTKKYPNNAIATCNGMAGCFWDATKSTEQCRVQQHESFQKVWGSDLSGQYLYPMGHLGDTSEQKLPSGIQGTWQTIDYYKDYHDDDEQKLDPRWTYEKSIDPRYVLPLLLLPLLLLVTTMSTMPTTTTTDTDLPLLPLVAATTTTTTSTTTKDSHNTLKAAIFRSISTRTKHWQIDHRNLNKLLFCFSRPSLRSHHY